LVQGYFLPPVQFSTEEANALYQQSGWVLHEHAEQLRALFAG
jgi:hypothetical protein